MLRGVGNNVRQVWINKTGPVSVLATRQVTAPVPAASEVLIKVAAAGVNFADIMMRRGLYPDAPALPAVPGYEVAGRVTSVGSGVSSEWVGRRVVAMCHFGGYSEEVCLRLEQVWPLPDAVDDVTAAALPVNYLTAWQMVRVMATVQSGDTVLVHSAAGGVGGAVVQLCLLAGATVIGSASPAKHAELKDRGVAHVLDSQARSFAADVRALTSGRGVEVALEPRHGRWIMESYHSLARCGRLILFGFSSAAQGDRSGRLSALRTLARVPWWQLNPIRLMNDNKSIGGVNLGRMWGEKERTQGWLQELMQLLVDGKISPVIDSVFPFSEAAQAHDRLEQRLNVGKVILVPDEVGS